MSTHQGTQAQQQASAPQSSVWVSASAGSGKTKVLIDRVLNLMLSGVPPESILCLTFTKAAAAEMENRLYQRLATWTLYSLDKLSQDLAALLNRPPSPEELTLAKQLFALSIDTPGGLKIQTIHGFCQSTLKRFPLEAGLSPHFEVIDEKASLELLQASQRDLLQKTDLEDTLAQLGQILNPQSFVKLSFMMVNDRTEFLNLPKNLKESFQDKFSVDLDTSPEYLIQDFHENTPHGALLSAIDVISRGTKTDQDRAQSLLTWVKSSHPYGDFLTYQSCYLTLKGEPRKKLITQSLSTQYPHIFALLQSETERVLALKDKLATLQVALNSYHLARFGQALVTLYEEKKRERAVLDYQDLILKTSHLLKEASCSVWVLYKLDGGIDHILIDEAQDTSPEQWQVVTALCEEFFAQDEDERTLFVVGDDKQSIYSFQGADPAIFSKMQDHFQTTAQTVDKSWKDIDLDISFRSTPEVLQAVDAIFKDDDVREGVSRSHVHHLPFRSQTAGHVELWPLVEPEGKEEGDVWPLPQVGKDQTPPPTRLAHLIAKKISGWLKDRKAVQGRPLKPGDIMILVRKRSPFVDQLIRALKKLNVPVAGVDRMVLLQQLPVMDLLKLAEFVLLPEDDLTLATVLKGPLFNMSEEDLFQLAHYRGEKDLWDFLKEQPHHQKISLILQDLIDQAPHQTPYQFFMKILGPLRGKALWQQRMGSEILDPLDEILNLALGFEKEHTPTLQLFLQWIHQDRAQLKRDLDQSNEVRIMTVHGSKGLQAPVVILPDTTQVPKDTPPFLWDQGHCVWIPPRDESPPWVQTLWQTHQDRQEEEYRRLLYVALTRAEDELYICGWNSLGYALPESCWYNLAQNGLATCGQTKTFDFTPHLGDEGWQGEGYVLASSIPSQVTSEEVEQLPEHAVPPPPWLYTPLRPDPIPTHPLTPSQLGGEKTLPALSPDPKGLGLVRGRVIHKLLEILPQLPASKWEEGCHHYLESQTLPQEEKEKITTDCLQILFEYPTLFTPTSQAEIPIVGLVGRFSLSGQIDRLIVDETTVHVVDYKTNVKPPESVTLTPESYLRQLAAYQAALTPLYPDHKILCSLLWTTLPRLDTIPQNLLTPYLMDPSAEPLAA